MTRIPLPDPSRHAVYTGRTTSWSLVICSGIGAFFVVLMGAEADSSWTDRWFVLPLALAGVGTVANVLTASSVRATAGPNGFTIHWGLVGWPRCSYSLDEIARAEVIDLPWWRVSWGFWWTPKRTSCTLRSGPALQLTLHGDRIVTVTIPEPEIAAATLHQACDTRHGSTPV